MKRPEGSPHQSQQVPDSRVSLSHTHTHKSCKQSGSLVKHVAVLLICKHRGPWKIEAVLQKAKGKERMFRENQSAFTFTDSHFPGGKIQEWRTKHHDFPPLSYQCKDKHTHTHCRLWQSHVDKRKGHLTAQAIKATTSLLAAPRGARHYEPACQKPTHLFHILSDTHVMNIPSISKKIISSQHWQGRYTPIHTEVVQLEGWEW